jgi:formylglycine-generating enzyme required for sulfatase activity
MGKLEVTWDEYDAFAFGQRISGPQHMDAQGKQSAKEADAVTRPTPPYADESFGFGKGRQPVVSITHHAAMEYCRWLSAKTGRTYRLPTEAEWEYACRAGTATAYSFGHDPKQLGEYGWHIYNADGRPRAGGQKKPNPWGLYDIHGYLWEWCSTADGGAVLRGGSWKDKAEKLTSAFRQPARKELKDDAVGLRCVLAKVVAK